MASPVPEYSEGTNLF